MVTRSLPLHTHLARQLFLFSSPLFCPFFHSFGSTVFLLPPLSLLLSARHPRRPSISSFSPKGQGLSIAGHLALTLTLVPALLGLGLDLTLFLTITLAPAQTLPISLTLAPALPQPYS